jgi:hypothetical protein
LNVFAISTYFEHGTPISVRTYLYFPLITGKKAVISDIGKMIFDLTHDIEYLLLLQFKDISGNNYYQSKLDFAQNYKLTKL